MNDEQVFSLNQQRLSGVNPLLAQAAWQIIQLAKQRGHTLIVAEGYRTNALQNEYYAQGRTKPGAIITYLRGGQSKHNHGEAVDFDFVINGQQSNSLSNNWALIGELAKQLKLVWGGNWKNLKDFRHVEMPKNYSLPTINYPQNSWVSTDSTSLNVITPATIVLGLVILYLVLD
jgi:peptidoglycan L-alanyl-D-glutamate endopeptidase CwlK